MWIVYGRPAESVEIQAFVEGLRRLSQPFEILSHNGFRLGQVEDGAAGAIVSGLRAEGALILESYKARGLPVIVIDYGYLKRVSGVKTFSTGYWQVGLNRLGWIPPFQCSKDRLQALKIEISSQSDFVGKKVFVCGQHAGDPSHGLEMAQIEAWALQSIERLKGVTHRPVVWRPHPDSFVELPGVSLSAGPMAWNEAHSIVCLNSTIGLEAILSGVPVVSRSDAFYAELSARNWSETLALPSATKIEKFLRRVAYAQWTLEEMRCGAPMNYLLQNSKPLGLQI